MANVKRRGVGKRTAFIGQPKRRNSTELAIMFCNGSTGMGLRGCRVNLGDGGVPGLPEKDGHQHPAIMPTAQAAIHCEPSCSGKRDRSVAAADCGSPYPASAAAGRRASSPRFDSAGALFFQSLIDDVRAWAAGSDSADGRHRRLVQMESKITPELLDGRATSLLPSVQDDSERKQIRPGV